jgi:hypothetical protein
MTLAKNIDAAPICPPSGEDPARICPPREKDPAPTCPPPGKDPAPICPPREPPGRLVPIEAGERPSRSRWTEYNAKDQAGTEPPTGLKPVGSTVGSKPD